MERHSPSSGSFKKRISPPSGWSLGLAFKDPPRTVRVILLGVKDVGKTALAVRFATRRFIGEYDSSTERIYKVESFLGASWEVTDPPAVLPMPSELQLRWADAIVVVYSISDRVSFDETTRIKLRLARARKGKKIPPVVILLGNKTDKACIPGERVVSTAEGQQRAEEMEAHAFREISVSESIEQVMAVFTDILKLLTEPAGNSGQPTSFRVRASTDGSLNSLRRPSPTPFKRRFSINVRGTLQ